MLPWWLIAATTTEALPRAHVAPRPVVLTAARYEAADAGHGRWALGEPGAGPVTAWLFPDGVPEHLVWREDDQEVRRVRCDVDGRPVETTTSRDGAPTEVRVHAFADHAVSVGHWREVRWRGWTLRVPVAPVAVDPLEVRWATGEWRTARLEAVDVADPAFRRDLEVGAGGRVIAAASAWVDGRWSARFTVDLPAPEPADDRVAEIWTIPIDGGVDVWSFAAPRGAAPASIDTLAPGRAIAALARRDGGPP